MKTIVHIIDSLNRGGAETLLLDVVRNLKGYNHHIITLIENVGFTEQEIFGMQITSLNFRSTFSYPSAIIRLRKVLHHLQPTLVHAHLPFSSFMARVAKPGKVPLFVSIHNNYSNSLKAVSKKMFFLERLLHSGNEELIFVSATIREDYEKIIGIKGPSHVLHNFIANKYFTGVVQEIDNYFQPEPLKLVAVGSLKHQKNFETLLLAMHHLDAGQYELDIYGEGPDRSNLEALIHQFQISNVRLIGSVPNIDQVLPCYDAFILASRYEGFGLAPVEAAASGLPLLLSELPVFREITHGHAFYFAPTNAMDIAQKISWVKHNYANACSSARSLKQIVQQQYTLSGYLERLDRIYQRRLGTSSGAGLKTSFAQV